MSTQRASQAQLMAGASTATATTRPSAASRPRQPWQRAKQRSSRTLTRSGWRASAARAAAMETASTTKVTTPGEASAETAASAEAAMASERAEASSASGAEGAGGACSMAGGLDIPRLLCVEGKEVGLMLGCCILEFRRYVCFVSYVVVRFLSTPQASAE